MQECRLFGGMDAEAVSRTAGRASLKAYTRGDVVAAQGSRCGSLMLLAEGQVNAETADRHGRRIASEVLAAPALIAPSILFSDAPRLPFTLTARTPATMLSFPREEFACMMRDDSLLMANFLGILSSHGPAASPRAYYMGCKTIKGKIARYILDRCREDASNEFHNTLTQREMADLFGVTRPALARALGEMSRQGAIYVKGKHVTVLFEEKLKQYIKQ